MYTYVHILTYTLHTRAFGDAPTQLHGQPHDYLHHTLQRLLLRPPTPVSRAILDDLALSALGL